MRIVTLACIVFLLWATSALASGGPEVLLLPFVLAIKAIEVLGVTGIVALTLAGLSLGRLLQKRRLLSRPSWREIAVVLFVTVLLAILMGARLSHTGPEVLLYLPFALAIKAIAVLGVTGIVALTLAGLLLGRLLQKRRLLSRPSLQEVALVLLVTVLLALIS